MSTEKIGLSKWLAMNKAERRKRSAQVQREHSAALQRLTCEEALKQTHQLLRLVDLLPLVKQKTYPQGIGVTLARKKL